MKTIVVGAGIIGALTGFRLAEAGADVTIIEAATPAAAASGASFGWINASFYADRDHFNLRIAGIEAHRRLGDALQSRATQWSGCLCWEQDGVAFDRQYAELSALGYEVQVIDRAAFKNLEPAVAAPEQALRLDKEAAVDLRVLAGEALQAATALGARLVTGVAVTGLAARAGRITGVRWSGGIIEADRVILATGVATEQLLACVDVPLPMLHRPALILQTEPLPPMVSHVLVSPGQELRQQQDGRFLAPTVAAHQGDSTEEITQSPEHLAAEAMSRVTALLQRKLRWTNLSLAARPVPQDGLPVIGACGPAGLYALTMHSGATLAPLVAELATAEVLETGLSNGQASLIAPYRPQRFTR